MHLLERARSRWGLPPASLLAGTGSAIDPVLGGSIIAAHFLTYSRIRCGFTEKSGRFDSQLPTMSKHEDPIGFYDSPVICIVVDLT